MQLTTLTALAGVLGSIGGAFAAVATAWVTQRTLNKRAMLQADIRGRENLYGEFIGECAKLLMDAFTHTLERPETLLMVYAAMNRIRLCASTTVLAEAELLLKRILDQYFSQNLTLDEVRELAGSDRADPLKAFGEACRVELDSMYARV